MVYAYVNIQIATMLKKNTLNKAYASIQPTFEHVVMANKKHVVDIGGYMVHH